VREVLAYKYTAYLDRLYRQVIHFILGLLIVGFNQTVTSAKSARAQRNSDVDSVVSTSSTVALVLTGNLTTSNDDDNNNSSSNRRANNCWSDSDHPRTDSRTAISNCVEVKSQQTAKKTDFVASMTAGEQLLPGQIADL